MLPTILVLLLLAGGVGDIWVRTDPGVTVSLDGQRIGVTTAEERGMWLRGLKEGPHELTVEVTGGTARKMPVDVVANQITTVEVSSIALRAGRKTDKSSVEIRLQPQSLTDCSATVGVRREQLPLPVTVIDDLGSGRHRLSVSCGDRSVRKDIEVPAGRTIIVEADFAAGGVVVLGDRPRIAELVVTSSSRELIVKSSLPAHAKRALAAAIEPGVEVVEIRSRGPKTTTVVFTTTNANAAARVVSRLKNTDEVMRIEVQTLRRFTDHYRLEVNLIFAE